MAADRFRSVVCLLVGHRWDWRAARGRVCSPYRCERCGHFDDEPKIARAANRRAWFWRWSPLTIKVGRKETVICAGAPWISRRVPSVSVRVDLHYGWEKHSEGPGITVGLHVWRLRAGVALGGLWQDEDGNGRALFRAWADFETFGWRYLPCWLGHKPETIQGISSCARCDTLLETAERATEATAA